MDEDEDTKGFYKTTFVVEGSGAFPFHLLHKDRCCPATGYDAEQLPRDHATPIGVTLLRFSKAGKSGPNVALWAKAGWRVLQVRFHDGTGWPFSRKDPP